ncbi:Electron transport complex protein RnfA [Salmonella enterica subsp. enterica]|nr:Electron transport complex protein RnfA [Salmonella enterica subsp. enterica]
MTDYLLLFVGTVLVNNFVLVKFLGLCPFMGVSKKLETAMGMGLATTFVMTLASDMRLAYRHLDTYSAGSDLSADASLYPRHCCGRAIYRNGCAENQPGVIPLVRHLLTTDYH